MYKVEPATVDDIPGIIACKKDGWLSYVNDEYGITPALIEEKFKNIEGISKRLQQLIEEKRSFIVRENNLVLGVNNPEVEDSGRLRVGALYVRDGYRGKGIGSLLLNNSIKYHKNKSPNKPIFLFVVEYNKGAIRFYERHGFVRTGVKKSDPIIKGSNILIPEIEMRLDV